MTTKELEKYLKETKERYTVTFDQFMFELSVDVDNDGKKKIFVSSFFSNMDFIDVEPAFNKTESAIRHIKKELKAVAKSLLVSIKEQHNMEQI